MKFKYYIIQRPMLSGIKNLKMRKKSKHLLRGVCFHLGKVTGVGCTHTP